MLKNNPNKGCSISVIFGIALFLFGVLIGGAFVLFLLARGDFFVSNNIDVQIDPISIISIAFNVILAIYVAGILTRRNEQDRVEKDILIKRLEKFQSNLDDYVASFLEHSLLDLFFVNTKIKTLRQDFNSINNLLKSYGFVSDSEDSCSSIDTGIRDLKDIFTDTPRSPDGLTAVTITNNKITISDEGRRNAEQKRSAIKDRLFDLIVKINRKK